MNIEEAKKLVKGLVFNDDGTMVEYIDFTSEDYDTWDGYTLKEYAEAVETLLAAYEKEKEKNKELENDLKDMTKRYMEAESVKFWYNYIHKDKIRKMLQELEDRRNKQPVIGYWSKKAMLEKLLKEE